MSSLFEGDYRRRPVQNLSGASRKSRKEELLSHAHLERNRRQEVRKQTEAAIIIQSHYRSYRVRSDFKRQLQQELRKHISGPIPTFPELEVILPLFIVGCNAENEEFEIVERILEIHSKEALKKMEVDPKWTWNIQKMSKFHLKKGLCKSFIETFLVPKNSREKIYQYLNKQDYFAFLGEDRILQYPELLQWPFEIKENEKAVESFCRHFLCKELPVKLEGLIRKLISSPIFPKHKAFKAILEKGIPVTTAFLRLAKELRPSSSEVAADYFKVLHEASEVLVLEMDPEVSDDEDDDEDEDEDMISTSEDNDIFQYFDEDWFSSSTPHLTSDEAVKPFVNFVFNLMVVGDSFGWKIPYKFPFSMWSVISSWSQYREDFTVDTDSSKLIAFAAVFSASLVESLKIVPDDEIDKMSIVSLSDVSRFLLKVWLGLTQVAFVGESLPNIFDEVVNVARGPQAWRILFNHVTTSLTLLYKMYERRGKDMDWLIYEPMSTPLTKQQIEELLKPFQGKRPHTLSIQEARMSLILKEFPFVVPLLDRFRTLQHLIREEKSTTQPNWHFFDVPTIRVNVRRGRMYEDAFNQLADSDHDLRMTIRVQITNSAGLTEAGIDGGGIFREFLAEVLTVGFNPNSGLFLQNSNNELYPNPNAYLLQRNASKHYSFLGKMLGKAIYENLLLEVPFAQFFLEKLRGSPTLSANYLASLDPVLYKNLLNLKTIEINDLGLDFNIQIDEYGNRRTVNLRNPNQPVTKANLGEYIALVADYKLNQQLDCQTIAFQSGLYSILNPWWLQLFSSKELQLLISGTDSPIDLQDLRQHTCYPAGVDATNPNIQRFWRVVEGFKNEERALLLKFVTSCSRPPLLGFKELDPPFCIQNVEGERLPSASTCLNLLKLPEFEDDETMREKLLYAIKSGAGFELS